MNHSSNDARPGRPVSIGARPRASHRPDGEPSARSLGAEVSPRQESLAPRTSCSGLARPPLSLAAVTTPPSGVGETCFARATRISTPFGPVSQRAG